jgi:PEGA domain
MAPAPATPVTTTPSPLAASPEPTPAAADLPAESALEDSGPEQAASDDVGSVIVVTGQDKARVFLNGKPQPQLTRNGQLRIRNLEPKDYAVRVSKNGFQDLPEQKIRVRKGEQAKLTFNLQPVPNLASLSIQGGVPGSIVLIDQTPAGTIQPDGTLTFATVDPGDHTIEIRKDRFKPRQVKRHFVIGSAVSLAAADVALEAAPGQLKVTFTPADAQVTVAKAGEAATKLSSGSPLSLAAGSYTITAKTNDNFSRSSTVEITAGQSRNLDLFLAPEGISKFDEPSAWKQEKGSFVRKGGDFVMYSLTPTGGTFVFSAMLNKGHRLQWVLNCTDVNNYILFQMDDNNFYRTVIKNGQKGDEIKIPHKTEKKSFHTIQIRVSPNEISHQIRQGDSWMVLDRWTPSGNNPSLGKFGFYIPGNDQVSLSSFSHYVDLSTR